MLALVSAHIIESLVKIDLGDLCCLAGTTHHTELGRTCAAKHTSFDCGAVIIETQKLVLC